jgi:Ca2+-transporting ATPase
VDRRRLWRRWVVAVFLGETLGFLVPVLAVVLGLPAWALLVAGAGEGAVLGIAQALVLRTVLVGFPTATWTVRTALAASCAWALGLAPSETAGTWQGWPPAAQVAVAVPAGLLLLASIGGAQWTVLRRRVPGAHRWIGWTALAWLAGLTVFLLVASPLWQPGQPPWLTAGIGVLAGSLMAVSMAAVTGWGLVRLLAGRPRDLGPDGRGTSARGPRLPVRSA